MATNIFMGALLIAVVRFDLPAHTLEIHVHIVYSARNRLGTCGQRASGVQAQPSQRETTELTLYQSQLDSNIATIVTIH
jgi:hypothetical protein